MRGGLTRGESNGTNPGELDATYDLLSEVAMLIFLCVICGTVWTFCRRGAMTE